MHTQNPLSEVPSCLNRIDELTHQVGRIKLQTEAVVGNQRQELFPNGGHGGKIDVAGIVLRSYFQIQLFTHRQISLVNDGGQFLDLFVSCSTCRPTAERPNKLASQAVSKLEGAHEPGTSVSPFISVTGDVIESPHTL